MYSCWHFVSQSAPSHAIRQSVYHPPGEYPFGTKVGFWLVELKYAGSLDPLGYHNQLSGVPELASIIEIGMFLTVTLYPVPSDMSLPPAVTLKLAAGAPPPAAPKAIHIDHWRPTPVVKLDVEGHAVVNEPVPS